MHLRPYEPAHELERCLAIWRAASEAGHPFLDAACLDHDASLVRGRYMPSAEVTVALIDGELVGFIAMLDSFIGGLFVDPGRHRCGAGRALVISAASCRPRLQVEVYAANIGARAFYAACGFVTTGRRERDDQGRPLPLIQMELRPGRS